MPDPNEIYDAMLADWAEIAQLAMAPTYAPNASPFPSCFSLPPRDEQRSGANFTFLTSAAPALKRSDCLIYQGTKYGSYTGKRFQVESITKSGLYSIVRATHTAADHRGAI